MDITGKGDQTELPKENPYASPHETAGWPVNYHNQWSTPHRGGLILGLGISGVVFCVAGFMCCAMFPLLSLALSIPAWVMGRNDLKAIADGTMDPTGHGSTRAGMVLGIIGTVLGGLAALLTVVVLAIYIVMFAYGLSTS